MYSRHQYSSRHLIIPVIVYTLIYNVPKFLEFKTVCPMDNILSNMTDNNVSLILDSRNSCALDELNIVARSFRLDIRPYTYKLMNNEWIDGYGYVIVSSKSGYNLKEYFSRKNYWYVNIYVLGLNTFLNIILPILSLVILNIIILR